MFNALKPVLRRKLLRPLSNRFGWLGAAAVILFVFGLNFAFPNFWTEAKSLGATPSFLGGLGGGGTEEVVNNNSPGLDFPDNSPLNSLSCFLNPRLSFPQIFNENQEEIFPIGLGEDTIFGYHYPLTTLSSKNLRDEIIIHTVVMGENPWTIAAHYGISANTVLWANNLDYWEYIKVGQKLTILPVSGVQHKVAKSDTVEKIAKKYRAEMEDIVAFNNLADEDDLKISEYLIVPDGEKPRPVITYKPVAYATYLGATRPAYVQGHCTWYVAQKRTDIPTNWSHAKYWLRNALSSGYSVCQGKECTPQKGAIISLNDSGWQARAWGHVAYVEEVNGNDITISEMNHVGRYKITKRNLNVGDGKIRGYIY